MNSKEKVLELLDKSQGKVISGEEIARQLGVTRNSVWKAIRALKNDGYDIQSQSNIGYVLSCDNDIFTPTKIKALSQNEIDVYMLEEESSSNDIAKKMAQEGAKEGTVVIVKRQTAGKGRLGRSFISNEENGLYMSIILRPQIPASKSVKITVAGAVAVLEAIEELSSASCKIKWVNDIYINEKKTCGILTEASFNMETGFLDYAILGIGINITQPKNGFDEEIKGIATAIYQNEAPKGFKSRLCALVVDKFLHYYKSLENEDYIGIYRAKSNLIGKEVIVIRGTDEIEGKVIDIDNDANLVVRTKEQILKFNSGEARIKK